MFSNVSGPPLLSGFMWSIVASCTDRTLQQSPIMQKHPSRSMRAFLMPLLWYGYLFFLGVFRAMAHQSIWSSSTASNTVWRLGPIAGRGSSSSAS